MDTYYSLFMEGFLLGSGICVSLHVGSALCYVCKSLVNKVVGNKKQTCKCNEKCQCVNCSCK